MKEVIIISVHPDDEILGAGGTLLRHKASGDNLHWIIVTSMLEEKGFSLESIEKRNQEISEVSQKLGFTSVHHLNYPTMELGGNSLITLVPKIGDIFKKTKAEIIYCVNRTDAHSDHRIVFEAMYSCTKSFRYPHIKKVLMYECLSETEFAPALSESQFIPNYFVDISQFLEKKIELMNIYKSEIGSHPFPRSNESIRALAILRGAQAGVIFAEAFHLLKFIEK